MDMTRENQISDALLEDQDKLKELAKQTPEEVTQYLKDKGYDFTVEEITEYGKLLQEQLNNANGELKEDDLDAVAGGKNEFKVGFVVGVLVGVGVLGGW